MSRWKALAAVADVRPDDLADRLTSALETLQLVADALGREDGSPVEPTEDGLLEAIGELRSDIDDAREEANDAQADVVAAEAAQAEAEARLEAKLQEDPPDVATLKAAAEDAIKERDEALQRLAQVEPLIEAYSDALAHARRFVSVAEQAGLKTKHVRKAGQ